MLYAKIPMERVGVLIGTDGKTKKALEERTGVTIAIDSSAGEVTIDESKCEDPTMGMKAAEVVRAIGRGFSEEKALKLLEEEVFLRMYDIKDYTRSRSRVVQLKGRLIGTRGKTRKLVEELTGASLSVYGHTVAAIGTLLQLDIACRAVDMLLQGSEHATVYRFLEKMRPRLRVEEMGF